MKSRTPEADRAIIKACPAIAIHIARKVNYSYGGYFVKRLERMIREGLLSSAWEPPQGFTMHRRKALVRVYRATEKGLALLG